MKKLGNVLYLTSPDAFLGLEDEALVIKKEDQPTKKLPLLNLEGIVCFNYTGVSPFLMGACVQRNINLTFLTPNGRFMARVNGPVSGNVLLRKKQFALSEDEDKSLAIARNCVLGKIYNQRKVLQRAKRDHALLLELDQFDAVIADLKELLENAQLAASKAELMAIEGNAAKRYFSLFDQLIFQQKDHFFFYERTRRPPTDPMNALLSFLYVLLANETASALEAVGLDAYVGFFHADRPGRQSLALDIMEELRPVLCDRLALNLVNRKQISGKGFSLKESGGVLMDDETRKVVIVAWQEKKKEELLHPFMKEKVPYGLLAHVQALLLARHLRGDLEAYPPFFWS